MASGTDPPVQRSFVLLLRCGAPLAVLVRNGSADRAYISFGLEIRLFTNNVIVSANCYDLHNRLVVALLTTINRIGSPDASGS